MFKNILVPTDFSPIGDEAVRVAREHFPDAQRTLLHVIQPRRVAAEAEGRHERYQGADVRKRLEAQMAGRLHEGLLPGERAEVTVGDPCDQILVFAKRAHADLIVMGTHGRQGLALFMSGSVATDVVRRARLPVLVVHEGDAREA